MRVRLNASMRRPHRLLLVVSSFAFAILCSIPLAPLASPLQQGTQRGGLRGRIGEKLRERAADAKETRQRVERPPTEMRQIAGLNVAIWKPEQRGRAPLLAFSHGFHGCNTQSTYLMQQFADAGYIVVAPNHKDAFCERTGRGMRPEERFGQAATWDDGTYRERGDDIRNLLEAMRRDSEWRSQVDWSRVGLVGHSLGGYTVLGLAGAWPSWRLPNIKAVLAWSPYCDPYALKGDLGGIRIPVMYQGGTRDLGITPSIKKSGGCFLKNASPAIFVEFAGAGHFAWTDLQDASLDLIDQYSLAFVDRYVRGFGKANPTERKAGLADLKVK
jgi:predicted dienelactone hydrolase